MSIIEKILFKARNFYFNCIFFNKNPVVHGWPTLQNRKCIAIGNRVQFNSGVIILAAGKVSIGNNVVLSIGCKIMDTGLDIDKLMSGVYEHKNAPVTIGDYVWIGAGAIILPGVSIGEYSVIGAGSVVVNDIPSYSMAVGSPAVVKRELSKRQSVK